MKGDRIGALTNSEATRACSRLPTLQCNHVCGGAAHLCSTHERKSPKPSVQPKFDKSSFFPISRLIYETAKVNSEITIKDTESGVHGNEGHRKYFWPKAD